MIDLRRRFLSFLVAGAVYGTFPDEVNEVHEIANEFIPTGDVKLLLCQMILAAGVIRDIQRNHHKESD